jgi:hypothetical protein
MCAMELAKRACCRRRAAPALGFADESCDSRDSRLGKMRRCRLVLKSSSGHQQHRRQEAHGVGGGNWPQPPPSQPTTHRFTPCRCPKRQQMRFCYGDAGGDVGSNGDSSNPTIITPSGVGNNNGNGSSSSSSSSSRIRPLTRRHGLALHEGHFDSLGAKVWPGGSVLAKFFRSATVGSPPSSCRETLNAVLGVSELQQSPRCLELGAGTGLVRATQQHRTLHQHQHNII